MFKSLVVGVLAGWFAPKVQSVTAGIVFGLAVGAFFAYLVARCVGGALLLGDRAAGERAGGHRRVSDAAVWAGCGSNTGAVRPGRWHGWCWAGAIQAPMR